MKNHLLTPLIKSLCVTMVLTTFTCWWVHAHIDGMMALVLGVGPMIGWASGAGIYLADKKDN